MYILFFNKSQNLNLNEEQIDYLIKNSDLKQQSDNGWISLMYAFLSNKDQKLNLMKNQFNYLIQNSDLKQKNEYGYTPLMYALKYNKKQKLNLNQGQWYYLFKNSDLRKQDFYGNTPLMYALQYNKTQNLKLTKTKFQEMYAALNKKQKQITFQKLIQKNVENENQYLEEINMFLYDFQFKTNEKILSWLTKNKHQDILERIEKRDLFFQLEVKLMDKKEKIATIKL